jgi:hypothetical protein
MGSSLSIDALWTSSQQPFTLGAVNRPVKALLEQNARLNS